MTRHVRRTTHCFFTSVPPSREQRPGGPMTARPVRLRRGTRPAPLRLEAQPESELELPRRGDRVRLAEGRHHLALFPGFLRVARADGVLEVRVEVDCGVRGVGDVD